MPIALELWSDQCFLCLLNVDLSARLLTSISYTHSDLTCQAAEAPSAATWCWAPIVAQSQLHLPSVPLQKRQGRLVKLIHLLIDRCVGTSLKNHQLSLPNVLLERVGKTG